MADMIGAVSAELGLSEEEKNRLMPSSSRTYVYDYVGWAKNNLKEAGLLESAGWGLAKITQQGLDVLKNPPEFIDRKYLRQFDSYKDFDSTSKKRGDAGGGESDDGTETPDETIKRGVDKHCKALHDDLSDAISQILPGRFERLVLELLKRMKYGRYEHTGGRGDGGVDGIMCEDELGLSKIRIQCKRYEKSRPVTPKEIREFKGALPDAGAKKGIFITTSKFTQDAKDEVKDLDAVVLIDGEHLFKLMDKHGVGVREKRVIRINTIDKDWFE